MPLYDPSTDPARAAAYQRGAAESPNKREAMIYFELAMAAEANNRPEIKRLQDELQRITSPTEDGLPDLLWGQQLESTKPELPEELVEGMLHRGAKMILSGGSKSFKTWCLLDLALSISQGLPWWGRTTLPGVVVYLNFEVQGGFFHDRILKVKNAKGMKLTDTFLVWNLRGYSTDHSVLLPKLAARLRALGVPIAAIILDPAYKVMGKSENEQENVAALMASIERLGEELGAATIFGAHFAKGDQSAKEAIDRTSGSGVFARDPDAILPMTRHEEDDTFVIEPILRNCPPVPAFCIKWEFPLMVPSDADPAALKSRSSGGAVKPPKYTVDDIMQVMPAEGCLRSEWAKHADDERGIGRSTAYNLIQEAIRRKRVEQRGVKFYTA